MELGLVIPTEWDPCARGLGVPLLDALISAKPFRQRFPGPHGALSCNTLR